METPRSIAAVLAAYSIEPSRTVALGSAGGFSGAEFWRVETPAETLCLRSWPPEHPSPDRLRYIHSVLGHVFEHGIRQIALPRQTLSNATFVVQDGRLWELTPWMPGNADFHRRPTPGRLVAAMQVLARFHLAAAHFGGGPNSAEASPGIRQRLELADRLMEDEARRIAAAIQADADACRRSRATGILDAFVKLAPRVRPALVSAARCRIELQPCLRDVWHDHVLFSADEVTGLVDFGALREECIAGDVARLLGSLVLGDEAAWRLGLQAYQQLRPMTQVELRLMNVFHDTNALLSGMNWLRWIYLEGRRFEELDRVLARMDENLGNLRRLQEKILESVVDFTEP